MPGGCGWCGGTNNRKYLYRNKVDIKSKAGRAGKRMLSVTGVKRLNSSIALLLWHEGETEGGCVQ